MRPSRSKPSRLEARDALQPRLAPRVRRVEMPVEHQRRPAARARPRAEDVRAAVLDLLPLRLQADRRRARRASAPPPPAPSPVNDGVETSRSARSTRRARDRSQLGQPRVPGMYALERVAQPRATRAVEPRQRAARSRSFFSRCACFAFISRTTSGRPYGNAVVVHSISRSYGMPDRRLAAADPRVAVRGLAEDVEAPRARCGLADPGLVRVRRAGRAPPRAASPRAGP